MTESPNTLEELLRKLSGDVSEILGQQKGLGERMETLEERIAAFETKKPAGGGGDPAPVGVLYDYRIFYGTDAADLDLLRDPAEVSLIKLLAQYPRVIEAAAKSHEPHRIAYYLYDLAAAFHGLWTKGREHAGLRFIVDDNRPLTASRLALVRGVRIVIASGLNLMGVVPVEELR